MRLRNNQAITEDRDVFTQTNKMTNRWTPTILCFWAKELIATGSWMDLSICSQIHLWFLQVSTSGWSTPFRQPQRKQFQFSLTRGSMATPSPGHKWLKWYVVGEDTQPRSEVFFPSTFSLPLMSCGQAAHFFHLEFHNSGIFATSSPLCFHPEQLYENARPPMFSREKVKCSFQRNHRSTKWCFTGSEHSGGPHTELCFWSQVVQCER